MAATEILPPLPPRSTRAKAPAQAPSYFSFAPSSLPSANSGAATPSMSSAATPSMSANGALPALDPPSEGGPANAASSSASSGPSNASSGLLSNLSPRHRQPPPRPVKRSPSSRPATPPVDANQQISPALSPSAARTPSARRGPPPLRLPPSAATGAPAAPSAPTAPPVPPPRRTSACAVTTVLPTSTATATTAAALLASRRASAPVISSAAFSAMAAPPPLNTPSAVTAAKAPVLSAAAITVAAPPPLSIPITMPAIASATSPLASPAIAPAPIAPLTPSVPPTPTALSPPSGVPPSRRASTAAGASSLSPSSCYDSVRIHTHTEDKTYDLKSPRLAESKQQRRVTPSPDIFREPDNVSGMLKMARHGPYHYLPMKNRWCIFSPRVQCLWYWANRKRGSKSHCLLIKGFKLDGAAPRQFFLQLEFDRLVLVETETEQEREQWIQSLEHAFDEVRLHADQKLSDEEVRDRTTTLERIRMAFSSEFSKSQIHVPKATALRKRSDAALPCL